MQEQISEEGKKEKEIYDKYMCYCKSNGADLSASIEASDVKMPQIQSSIEASTEKLALTKDELATAQQERTAAKGAMEEAKALREKEAAAFSQSKTEADTNIAAIEKAIAALKHGMAGGFLQTRSATLLRHILLDKQFGTDEDKELLIAFLSTNDADKYSPQSGEITGILEEIGADMKKSRADLISTEKEAIQSYEDLMSAKKKEVLALGAAIESKSQKIGELGVSIASMKAELADEEQSLIADKNFLAGLEKGCSEQTADFEERSKTRAEELVAIADTIKVLNDDDALDLFKTTLPSGSSSFVQVRTAEATLRQKVLSTIQGLQQRYPNPHLDLISLALQGKKVGLTKVIKMIDTMVQSLKQEQTDEDHKKEYCAKQFDLSDDSKKALQQKIADAETGIAVAEDSLQAIKEEIESLEHGLKALDKAVASATEDRKAQHAEVSTLLAQNSAAKELLEYAKNRLNKFYNPKLYRAPPKQNLTREEQIAVNLGGTPPPTEAPGGIAGTGVTVLAQVSAHSSLKHGQSPEDAPPSLDAYTTKGQESNGVIAMLNLLIKDLDKEMTEAETSEKNAQLDYETAMSDAAAKHTADKKALNERYEAKANLEASLDSYNEEHRMTTKELMANEKYIAALHSECDWLLKYFDVRKSARASEVDALNQAKAVLSGADFALFQTKALRGSSHL